jgi:hypothetical protein
MVGGVFVPRDVNAPTSQVVTRAPRFYFPPTDGEADSP